MFSGSLLTPSHMGADQLSATVDSRPGIILYQDLNAGKTLFEVFLHTILSRGVESVSKIPHNEKMWRKSVSALAYA